MQGLAGFAARADQPGVERTNNQGGARLKRGTVLAPLSAIFSAIVAASCCLPLGTFAIAAGFAGAGAFMDSARPYFLGLSLLLLGFGFWQTYGSRSCAVRRSRAAVFTIWFAAGLVLILLLFPQAIAGFLADLSTKGSAR